MTIAAEDDDLEGEMESEAQAKLTETLRDFLLPQLHALGHHADALVVALGDHAALLEMYYKHYDAIIRQTRRER